jgi:cytochrome o ubiquinol oxidase subunit II
MSKRVSTAKKFPTFLLFVPLFACLVLLFALLIKNGNMQLLEPAGYVANIQSQILWGAIIFAGVIGSLIIGSFFFIALRYKEGVRTRYEPGWTAGKKLLLAGWGIPLLAIIAISFVVWATAHQVDPYRSISSTSPPVTIQVVALRWKWLFIYPNDRIAAVNTMEIPVGTPIALQLTADAPMNSFWVPRLSGQVYAMTGMVTQLHIEADKPGTYAGSPAEISGDDFAGMDFTVKAVSADEYAAWKSTVAENASEPLDYAAYTALAKPSSYNQTALYTLADPHLFHDIVMQFMTPDGANSSTQSMSGMKM